MIRQMPFEEMEIAVGVAISPVLRADRYVARLPPGPRPWTRSAGHLVMDVGGGHHRLVAPGQPLLDAFENYSATLRSLRILRVRFRDFLRSRSQVLRPLVWDCWG